MTDFLGRLAERSLGVGELVRPRPASLFEPDSPAASLPIEQVDEVVGDRLGPVRRAGLPSPSPARAPAQPEGRVRLRGSEPQSPLAAPPSAVPDARPAGGAEPALAGPPDRVTHPEIRRETSIPSATAATAAPADTTAAAESVVVRTLVRDVPYPVESRHVELRGSEPQSPPRDHEAPGALARAEAPSDPWFAAPASPTPLPPRAAGAEPAEPPVVHVTIGRVDVRAVVPPPSTEPPRPRRRPRLTLEEYLREAGGGG